MIVLNVGGGGSRELPRRYAKWDQHLLDIDKNVKPDIVCDAKKMKKLKPKQYDAVFCSHNLEHFYQHEVLAVLDGFLHVLKPEGFADIAVPNIQGLFKQVVEKDINDMWYPAGPNPISFHDVIYGWGKALSEGNLYYAHKCGFSPKSLQSALLLAGFSDVHIKADDFNINALAFKKPTTRVQARAMWRT